jgi:N-acetylglucosamine-6-phosphate deacetylase
MDIEGRRYDDGRPIRVEISQGTVSRCRELSSADLSGAALPWIAPGFVDIQVNGYGGVEFSSPSLTPDQAAEVVRRHFALGVTGICPTLTTQSDAVFQHGIQAIVTACRSDERIDRAVAGIHLEGPYISPEDGPRGAHPREHCRPPDWDEFARWLALAEDRIKLMTLSPEYPSAPDFIARATQAGVVVAIGHLNASRDQIRAAVDAGARLSTHLGNGAHRDLPRHPNYLWSQLAEDRLLASLIVDGHHLPPEVVRTFVRAKGAHRCILVSDVSGLAGLPPGTYPWSGGELEILDDGRIAIAGQRQLLAGASQPIGEGIARVMAYAGVSLAQAIEMASTRPARLIGRTPGGFLPGDPADYVTFHWSPVPNGSLSSLTIVATYLRGELVYSAPTDVALGPDMPESGN